MEEAAPASARAPWPTLPLGPPPFHQHLFNRNIKGAGAPPSPLPSRLVVLFHPGRGVITRPGVGVGRGRTCP